MIERKKLYQLNAIKRSIIIWLGFQVILWLVFAVSYYFHSEAWLNVVEVEPITAAVGGWWSTFLFILLNNLFICGLIIAGNLLARFSTVTAGLPVLLIQGVMIGWLGGSNGFEVPFLNTTAQVVKY